MMNNVIEFKNIKIGDNFYDKKLYKNWEGDTYCKRYFYKKVSETKAFMFSIEKEVEMSLDEWFFLSPDNTKTTNETNEFVGDYW